MGYTTEFEGRFQVTPAMKPEHVEFLYNFSGTRRMRRDVSKLIEKYGPEPWIGDMPYGHEGEYFCGDWVWPHQNEDETVVSYNDPPSTQPGLWCQWVPTEDGEFLEWDGNEKFYYYTEWLEYIIENFMKRWGYSLTGITHWQGEEMSDYGTILVYHNKIAIINQRRVSTDEPLFIENKMEFDGELIMIDENIYEIRE